MTRRSDIIKIFAIAALLSRALRFIMAACTIAERARDMIHAALKDV